MSNDIKKAANNMIAGDVFHVGEFLMEELQARGLKQVDLANQLELSKTEINLLVHGKRGMTVPVALKLERVMGISAETWMNLQVKFEIDTLKRKMTQKIKVGEEKKRVPRRKAMVPS